SSSGHGQSRDLSPVVLTNSTESSTTSFWLPNRSQKPSVLLTVHVWVASRLRAERRAVERRPRYLSTNQTSSCPFRIFALLVLPARANVSVGRISRVSIWKGHVIT